jgi:hypothetical protein
MRRVSVPARKTRKSLEREILTNRIDKALQSRCGEKLVLGPAGQTLILGSGVKEVFVIADEYELERWGRRLGVLEQNEELKYVDEDYE